MELPGKKRRIVRQQTRGKLSADPDLTPPESKIAYASFITVLYEYL